MGGRVQCSLQDLCGGQAGVDHAEPLRLSDGKLAIRRAHALEKGVGLDLDAIGFAATASIKRSDFAMGMDVPLVSDNVDLVINAGFEAE